MDDVGFIIHVIENGVLLKTVYSDELPEDITECIAKTNYVLSGYGEFIGNIHSINDIYRYKSDLKLKIKEIREANKERQKILNQITREYRQLKNLKKNTQKYKEKVSAINEMQKQLKEHSKTASSKIEKINKKFAELWGIDNNDYYIYEHFGIWIEAGIFHLKAITRYQENNNEEYVIKYQEEIEYYKKNMKKEFKQQLSDKDFIKNYLEWSEATPDELTQIENLFKEIEIMSHS